MNFRPIALASVSLLFSALLSGCGAYYVAQSREAVNFGDLAGPAKDWVAACQEENINKAAAMWSKVNGKAAYEESAFMCGVYKQSPFDIDSVEELVPPYCVAPVCVFVRRRVDNWWGMITVQVAKNLQDDRKKPFPYSEGNVVVAVQYGTQQRNCSKDLLPKLFAECFWQEPLTTPTPVPAAKERVGIQAGHWKIREVPDELASLRSQTGTSGGGTTEWQVTLNVANLVAEILRKRGYAVDVLPATVPEQYKADVFVSLHTDGNNDPSPHGYKATRSCFSINATVDDRLLVDILEEYGKATKLEQATNVTEDMRCYYAFNYSTYKHAIAQQVPATLLEMGYLTNPDDQRILINGQSFVAAGIANAIDRFLRGQ